MAKALNINAKPLVELANKLEKLGRSDMPLAVRGTLNDVAFQAKQKNIPQEFSRQFTERKKNFIRSHTFANKSQNTFDINAMETSAGVLKGKSQSGDRLEKQETGGRIPNREKIPSDEVRVSKSPQKLVAKKFYYKKYKNAKKGRVFTSKRMTIIKTDKALLMVSRGGKWKKLYSLNKSISLKKASFIQPAGEKAAKLIPTFFLRQAKRRIEKYYK